MAETQRTKAEILALLPDNTTGDVSPQDGRDAIESIAHTSGQLYVTVASATSIAVVNTWYEVTAPTWAAGGHLHDWSHVTNGRLQYDGVSDRDAHATVSGSVTSAGSNKTYEFALAVNGVIEVPSIVRNKIGAAGDVGALVIISHLDVTAGDYISAWVRNITDTSNITFELAVLDAFSLF